MGKRLCNDDILFFPIGLISRVKDQSKVQKSLLVGGQCLNRVMFCLKPIDVDGFSLKLEQYLMFLKSHFCVKV